MASQSWERILKSATWSLDFPSTLAPEPASCRETASRPLRAGPWTAEWALVLRSQQPQGPRILGCSSHSLPFLLFRTLRSASTPNLDQRSQVWLKLGKGAGVQVAQETHEARRFFLRYRVEAFLILGRPLVFPKLLHSRTSSRSSSDAFRTLETKTESASPGVALSCELGPES